MGQGHIIVEVSRSHSGALQSVQLLWTSDQPVAETLPDNTQQSQQTGVHASGSIRTRSYGKPAVAEPRLRQLGHLLLAWCHVIQGDDCEWYGKDLEGAFLNLF